MKAACQITASFLDRPWRQSGVALAISLLAAIGALACSTAVPAAPTGPTQATLSQTPESSDGQAEPADVWRPELESTWQWQLTGLPVEFLEVDVYDVDLFETEASTVDELHRRGARVICYVSAGSWEEWRPDAASFPSAVIGNDYEGWSGEKWLDIRQIDAVAPLMGARLDECKAKGFDAVEPDNIDGYTNDTGFPLTYEDPLKYNRWLADEAHIRGLSIGLKNDPDQVADLVDYFDWALTEDCFDQGWCEDMTPFVEAGKAVFAAEYTDTGITIEEVCAEAARLNFNAVLKNRDLDAYRDACPAQSR